MKAQEARPQRTPSSTKASRLLEAEGMGRAELDFRHDEGRDRVRSASGRSSVAAPVAMTTGRKVRFDTSGSRISRANSTPPSGVLKVAAMPAPAPAESRVTFCQVASRIACEKAEPSAAPIWMIGPSRPTAAPVPIDRAPRPATSPPRPASGCCLPCRRPNPSPPARRGPSPRERISGRARRRSGRRRSAKRTASRRTGSVPRGCWRHSAS